LSEKESVPSTKERPNVGRVLQGSKSKIVKGEGLPTFQMREKKRSETQIMTCEAKKSSVGTASVEQESQEGRETSSRGRLIRNRLK